MEDIFQRSAFIAMAESDLMEGPLDLSIKSDARAETKAVQAGEENDGPMDLSLKVKDVLNLAGERGTNIRVGLNYMLKDMDILVLMMEDCSKKGCVVTRGPAFPNSYEFN